MLTLILTVLIILLIIALLLGAGVFVLLFGLDIAVVIGFIMCQKRRKKMKEMKK